jgi:hypothetical protein
MERLSRHPGLSVKPPPEAVSETIDFPHPVPQQNVGGGRALSQYGGQK